MTHRKMQAHEISALVDDDVPDSFITHMTFDEHPFEVVKYEIQPAKNKLLIHVKAEEA